MLNIPVIRQTELAFAYLLALSMTCWMVTVFMEWPLAMLATLIISAIFSCGFIVFFVVVRLVARSITLED